MALEINWNPAKNYSADGTYTELVSRWVASDSPIVFKISNTKFPLNSEDTEFQVLTVTQTDANLSEIVMSSDHDFFVGQYVKIDGFTTTEYNGVFKVLDTPAADSVVIGVTFNNDVAFTLGAFVQRAYLNYHNRLRVYAGLPSGHKWQILKPMQEVGIVKSEPNTSNISTFDIQEYVKSRIETPVINDLTLVSLPNDLNLWTAFYIEFNEVYTDFAGGDGISFDIIDYANSGGSAQFELSGLNFDFQVGDSIVLSGFTDSIYNRVWEITEINESSQLVTINYPYDPYFTLYGTEQAEGFSRSLRTVESSYTTDTNVFYASKARVPFGNSYLQQALGNNLAQFLNIDPVDTDDLAVWPSDFEDLPVFENKYFDITHYIDKSLTDSLASDEQISLEFNEYDEQGNFVQTQYYKMNNQEEGVWRMPFLGPTPLPTPLAVIVESIYPGGYVKITNGTTTVESVTGTAILLVEEGDEVTVTLSDDDTKDSGNDALLWAGVGLPSTPQDVGVWTTTQQSYPHGMAVGDQIWNEKQITFTATQTNKIDAGFFNRLTMYATKVINFTGYINPRIEAVLQLDDGKGNTFSAAQQSGTIDTNAPQSTFSAASDLTGREPLVLDHAQTTSNKTTQPLVSTIGGKTCAEGLNGSITGLKQLQATQTNQTLYDRLVASGYGTFGVFSAASAGANGTADSGAFRYSLSVFYPTNNTFTFAFSPVVDMGTFSYAATAALSYFGGFTTGLLGLWTFSGVNQTPQATPYRSEFHLSFTYSTKSGNGGFAQNSNGANHFENSTDGILEQEPVNGGSVYSVRVALDQSTILNDGRFEATNSAVYTSDSAVALFFQSVRAWNTAQRDWFISLIKEDFSI